MFKIDALGKACPLPVIETKKALREHEVVQTLVDNEIAHAKFEKNGGATSLHLSNGSGCAESVLLWLFQKEMRL